MWFYFTSRYFTNEYYLADRYYPVDISDVVSTQRYVAAGVRRDVDGRQQRSPDVGPTEKQKISGWYAYQRKDDPHWLIADLRTGRLKRRAVTSWHTQLSTFQWTYTATNRLLFEPASRQVRARTRSWPVPSRCGTCPSREQGGTIAIVNPTGLHVPCADGFTRESPPITDLQGSSSYVTGSAQRQVRNGYAAWPFRAR